MRERLTLIYDRLRTVPSEHAVPEPFSGFFTDTAGMLLDGGRAREETADWADPGYAERTAGAVYGPLLSAVYVELRLVREACGGDLVHPADETWTCMLIELFLELYGEFSCEEIPGIKTVERIFADYLTDYLPDYEEREVSYLLAVEPDVPRHRQLPLVLMTPGTFRRAAELSKRPQIVLAHAEDLGCVLDAHFAAKRKRVLQEVLDARTEALSSFRAAYPDPLAEFTERSGWLYTAETAPAPGCRMTRQQRVLYEALGQELIGVAARYLS